LTSGDKDSRIGWSVAIITVDILSYRSAVFVFPGTVSGGGKWIDRSVHGGPLQILERKKDSWRLKEQKERLTSEQEQ